MGLGQTGAEGLEGFATVVGTGDDEFAIDGVSFFVFDGRCKPGAQWVGGVGSDGEAENGGKVARYGRGDLLPNIAAIG